MLVISRIISQLIEKKKTVPFGTICTSVSLNVTSILNKQKNALQPISETTHYFKKYGLSDGT